MLDLSKFKFLFFTFLFIFLVGTPFISAQPPFQQSEVQEGFLIIETAYPTSHKVNEDFYVHAHVYNGTSGVLITDNINCFYHFYNHQLSGDTHIDTGILTQYGDGYRNETDGNLLDEVGEYSLLIWCNSTTEGGFFEYTFDVTADGQRFQTFPNQFFLIILALGFIFLSFSSSRLTLFKYLGALLAMVMGVITIYPGYNFINHSTLMGLGLGIMLIALGFYYLVEEAFSREKQSKKYDQYHKEELNEVEEDLFDDD